MNGKVMTCAALILSVFTSTAAAAGSREDNSSLVVWIFLGFCALIVILQVVPAILSAREAARAEQERRNQGTAAERVSRERV